MEESGLREGQDRRTEDSRREDSGKAAKSGGVKPGSGGGNGYRGPSGTDDSKTARYQGNLVCFHYNNRNMVCSRKPVGDGCDNGRGGIFAHVCNFHWPLGSCVLGNTNGMSSIELTAMEM